MWFDGVRQPNTMYVASVSRGKDSTAMLRAIQLMGWPLDAIVSVDIWFDNDTPAELPPLVSFKDEWDAKCLDWFGVPVTRLCARKRERADGGEDCHSRLSYTDLFYERLRSEKNGEHISGFPCTMHGWCKRLKDTANKRDVFAPDIQGHLLPQGISQERERELRSGRNDNGDFQIKRVVGVLENSRMWQFDQRISLEEGGMVSRPTQGECCRQSFSNSPRTRGRK